MREFIEKLAEFEEKSLYDGVLAAMLIDRATPIDKYLTAICHQHGVAAFADGLKKMLETPINRWENQPAVRDLKWLSTLCCDSKLVGERQILAGLCDVATNQFRGSYCDITDQRRRSYEPSMLNDSLRSLLQANCATGFDQLAAKLVTSVRSLPERFPIQQVQGPCLLKLIPWSQKKLKHVHPVLRTVVSGIQPLVKPRVCSIAGDDACYTLQSSIGEKHEWTSSLYRKRTGDCKIAIKSAGGTPSARLMVANRGAANRLIQNDFRAFEF